MEMALYDTEHGYYYRGDPFGKAGDFYTASQLQPVFGAYLKTLADQVLPGYERFVDVGAGRQDLRESFADGVYEAVQHGENLVKTNRTILFSNELFDALPVDLECEGQLLRVAMEEDQFVWQPHGPCEGVKELRAGVKAQLERAWTSIEAGSYIIIDYGYRRKEAIRFPLGSLMSYRRHLASEEVLSEPGLKDITAHVDWDALIDEAQEIGWKVRSLESLRASMLGLGEAALEGLNSLNDMQFKTLFFSLGESFEVLILDKN